VLCSLARAQRPATRPTLSAILQAASDHSGSALACQDIRAPRIQLIVDKFTAVIRKQRPTRRSAPTLRSCSIRTSRNGRGARDVGTDGIADRRTANLADFERSIAAPALPAVIAPPAPAAAPSVASSFSAATPPRRQPHRSPSSRGPRHNRSRNPVRIAAPFFRLFKELRRQMKLGIDTAFNRVNDTGGVEAGCSADRGRRRFLSRRAPPMP